ncbi:helix-turn-helix domain-containing protein [Streptomyces sp. NPDC046984]|uniref:helix-turn-helix domain-containing protein n=1 Tax=Streptomyces sp. NPDC046984 TaxID=3155138 RepID=UPI0033D388B7
MNQRRLELRMNWRQVADAAGISYTALRAIRRGEYRPTELTARGLDEALRWAPDSLMRVLEGGAPTPIEQQHEGARVDATEEAPLTRTGGATEQELELLRRAITALAKELRLSPDEAEEAFRRARRDIERPRPRESDDPPEGASRRRAV